MNDKQLDRLEHLVKLDIDAAEAYEQALEKIETPDVHERISKYMQDHREHVHKLSNLLMAAGRTPPEMKKDLKGYLIEGMTSLRSITGEEGALKALHSNEKLTNKKYKQAAEEWDFTGDARQVILENYADEQRHIAYVEQTLHVKAEKH